MAAHQAPWSLLFSRQEHWNVLPFPSPMHESERWKWSHSVVSNSSRPPGLQPTRLLRPWDFPGKSAGVGCHRLLRDNILASTFFENSFPCTNVNSFTFWAVYLTVPRNTGLLPAYGPDKHLRFEDVHFLPVCSFCLHPTIGSGYYLRITYIWKWLHKVMSKYPRLRLSEL